MTWGVFFWGVGVGVATTLIVGGCTLAYYVLKFFEDNN